MFRRSSGLSFGPTVRQSGRRLVVRTGRRVRWLTVGLADRTVVVDPDKRVVRVCNRRWWMSEQTDKYPFDLIAGVTFGLPGWWASNPAAYPYVGVTDTSEYEVYSVGLRLYGYADGDVHLFRFAGAGYSVGVGASMPLWFSWYQALGGVSGTHEAQAHRFVDALAGVIGKPIVPK